MLLFLCGFEGILLLLILLFLNLVIFYLLGIAGAHILAQEWRSKDNCSLLSSCGANDRAEVIKLGSQGLCPVSGVLGFWLFLFLKQRVAVCLTLASKWQQSSCFSLPNAEITGVCFSSRLLQHPKAMVLRCQRLDKGTVNVSPLLAPVQMAHTRVRDGPFWAPAVPAPLETEAEKQPHIQG